MLEIRVSESITIADSLEKALRIVLEKIEEWSKSESTIPLSVKITKVEDRGPPTLEINVQETIKTKAAFG